MVYNSLVLPNLTYCNLIWSNACESRINKIIGLQKKSIRIISKTTYLAHTNPLFKKLGLLKMCDIPCHQILILMYKFSRSLLPENFVNYFCENCKIHSHLTRNSTGYNIPFAKTGVKKRSIRIEGPRLWNSLDSNIRNAVSLPVFKKKLKCFFLSKY